MLFLIATLFLPISLVAYIVYQRHFHPLSAYPGPFFGSISNFYRFIHELRGDLPLVIHQHHLRYGPVVRVSPSELTVNTGDVIDVVYKKGGRHYPKTEFYDGFTAIRPNVFGTRDEALHSLRRRQMAHAFSMGSLTKMEYIFDRHVKDLLERLSTYHRTGEEFELKHLLKFFIQDTNGDLSLGVQFNTQIAGDPALVPPLNDHIALAKLTGFVPWLKPIFDSYGRRLPWPYLQRLISLRAEMRAQAEEVADLEFKRIGRIDDVGTKQDHVSVYSEDEDAAAGRWNLFTGLVRARDPDTGEPIPRDDVTSNAITFLVAGNHSTASTLEVIFWYLLHYPEVMSKCQKEIDDSSDGDENLLPYTGLEARLPYLSAVLKECFRLSPVFQHPAPRYTPADSSNPRFPAYLPESDITLPPNTAVSVSVYSLHRNKEVWGTDAEEFRPERWLNEQKHEHGQELKQEPEHKDLIKANEGHMFHFGAGHGACIGRNQSLIMIWKCIVEVLRRFDFALVDLGGSQDGHQTAEKEPHMRVTGFAEVDGALRVKVTRRTSFVHV